jgi:hypothetical protein
MAANTIRRVRRRLGGTGDASKTGLISTGSATGKIRGAGGLTVAVVPTTSGDAMDPSRSSIGDSSTGSQSALPWPPPTEGTGSGDSDGDDSSSPGLFRADASMSEFAASAVADCSWIAGGD